MRGVNSIAIIDDSTAILEMLIPIMMECFPLVNVYGYNELDRINKQSALWTSDIVFVDYNLGESERGSDWVRKIKENSKDVVCVGWSSDYDTNMELRKDFYDAGADYVINKVIDIEKVREIVMKGKSSENI